jgi:hypothetical protein
MFIFFNKRMRSVVLTGVAAMFIIGCRKDVEEIRPYPVTLDDLAVLLYQVPSPAASATFSLNRLSQDTTLTTPGGIRIKLTDVDQLFARRNGLVPVPCSTCDDLSILTTAVASKGDMLSRGLPTYAGDGSLLETVGMVQIRFFCGNEELQLLPGRSIVIQLPAHNVQSDVLVYTFEGGGNRFEGWEASAQVADTTQWPVQGGLMVQRGYSFAMAELGWINCAKPFPSSATTPFSVILQSGYTGLNTHVYLVFEQWMSVVPLQFDDSTRTFYFPKVPAGYPVRIVSVSKLDSVYWLGTASTETGTHTILPVQPQQQTSFEVLGYLQGL